MSGFTRTTKNVPGSDHLLYPTIVRVFRPQFYNPPDLRKDLRNSYLDEGYSNSKNPSKSKNVDVLTPGTKEQPTIGPQLDTRISDGFNEVHVGYTLGKVVDLHPHSPCPLFWESSKIKEKEKGKDRVMKLRSVSFKRRIKFLSTRIQLG